MATNWPKNNMNVYMSYVQKIIILKSLVEVLLEMVLHQAKQSLMLGLAWLVL